MTEHRLLFLTALNNKPNQTPNSPSSQGDQSDSNRPHKFLNSNDAGAKLKLKHMPKRNDAVKSEQTIDLTSVASKPMMQLRKSRTASTSLAQNSPSLRGVKRKVSTAFQDLDRIDVDATIPSSTTEMRSPDVKHAIKRVRLFQRPRPISYTHPLQIPPKSQYDGSIRKFLGSYITSEDGDNMTIDTSMDPSTMEAELRARIRTLRKDGRLTLNVLDLPESFLESPSMHSQTEGKHEDHHQNLMSSALQKGRTMLAESSFKRVVAKRISKNVLAWHANHESNEEKVKKAEVLRMKTLAKLTAKEVERQWKKAVFVS